MFNPPTRIGVAAVDGRVRPGAGRPRGRHQQRDRRVRAAGRATSGRWRGTWPRAADRPGRVLPRTRELRRRWCRSPRPRPACSGTSTPRSARWPASRCRSCRRGSRRRRRLQSTIAGSPVIRPFLTDTAALFKELRPGAATLPQSAPVLADALRRRHPQPPGHGGARPAHARLSRTLQSSARPGGAAGARPADADRSKLWAAAGVPHPGPDLVQLRDAVPAQHRRACCPSTSARAALLRFVPARDRRHPGRRVGAVADSRTPGPSGDAHGPLHVEPVSEHRLAGPDRGMRRRQRAVPAPAP